MWATAVSPATGEAMHVHHKRSVPPRKVTVLAVRERDGEPIRLEPGWFLPAMRPRPDAWELLPSGVRFDVATSRDVRFLGADDHVAELRGHVQCSHVDQSVFVHVEARRHKPYARLEPPPPLTIEVAFRKLPARVLSLIHI